MTDFSNKRKERTGDDRDKKVPKRSKGRFTKITLMFLFVYPQEGLTFEKGGSGGKWQTPHQVAKAASRGNGKVEAGDMGIWATCARTMEGRAITELKSMFEECAKRFYGLVPPSEDKANVDLDGEDIEVSIQRELATLVNKDVPELFSPVWLDMDCVMFFKTLPPIDPVDFVHKICVEVASNPDVKKMRYVNRLSPNTMITAATEVGLAKLGKTVLATCFKLSCEVDVGDTIKDGSEDKSPTYSYAIRPTIRAHKVMGRDLIINQIAAMVADVHEVNLTKPDKVIIVDVFQGVCGMSVVDGDWDTLKRFNLAELYKSMPMITSPPIQEAKTELVEAAAAASGTTDP